MRPILLSVCLTAEHWGLTDIVLAQRSGVLAAAYALHPERFPRGCPRPQSPPKEVWINKPKGTTAALHAGQVPGNAIVRQTVETIR